MIRHILLWNYKDEATQEERARVESELAALPSRITAMRGLEWGPVVGGRNQSFTHCFIMEFDSMEAVSEYAAHPEHVKFAGPFRAACAAQVVADVEIQS